MGLTIIMHVMPGTWYRCMFCVLFRYMNVVMARAYCHKIVKLSPVIQTLAPEKETVCNVHGVREKFLEVGDEYAHKVSMWWIGGWGGGGWVGGWMGAWVSGPVGRCVGATHALM